ncbi:hypothetical protein ColLi_13089 [Colletotrichum liriopes]|uniref:Uncharacterized protein n=1 Tax=Colletotrichum liriopes TaxID=708192 RepID=A0AA37M068_9PEZI|nr:hypothetical protein ColLi_13089 [Colletotrichum liriopes]
MAVDPITQLSNHWRTEFTAFVNSLHANRNDIYSRLTRLEADLAKEPYSADPCDVRRHIPGNVLPIVVAAIPTSRLNLGTQNSPKVRKLAEEFGITENRLLFSISYDLAQQGHNFFRALANIARLTHDWEPTLELLCRCARERRLRPLVGRRRRGLTLNDVEAAQQHLRQRSPAKTVAKPGPSRTRSAVASRTKAISPPPTEEEEDGETTPHRRHPSRDPSLSPEHSRRASTPTETDTPSQSSPGWRVSGRNAESDHEGSIAEKSSSAGKQVSEVENGGRGFNDTLFDDNFEFEASHVARVNDIDNETRNYDDGPNGEADASDDEEDGSLGWNFDDSYPSSGGQTDSVDEDSPNPKTTNPEIGSRPATTTSCAPITDSATSKPSASQVTQSAPPLVLDPAAQLATVQGTSTEEATDHRPKRRRISPMPPMAGQAVDTVRTEGEKLATEYFDMAVGRIAESQGHRFNYLNKREVEKMLQDNYEANKPIAKGVSQAALTILPILAASDQWIICVVEQDLRKVTEAYLFDPSGSNEHVELAQRHINAFVSHYLPTSLRRNCNLIRGATSRQARTEDSGIHAFLTVLSVITRRPVCAVVHVGVTRHMLAAFLRAEMACPVPDQDDANQAGDLEQFNRENPDITNTKQLLERVRAWRSARAAQHERDLSVMHETIIACGHVVKALLDASSVHLLDLEKLFAHEVYLCQLEGSPKGTFVRPRSTGILKGLEELSNEVELRRDALKQDRLADEQ